MAGKKSVAAEEAKKSVAAEEAKKVVAKAEDAKEVKAEKAEKKPAAEKKPVAEKKPAAKKPAVKKETAKKEPAKKTAKVVVQYAGLELDTEAVLEAAKAAYKAENKAAIKDITLYIKPEDGAAYYVVNGKVTGKVAL